MPKWMICASHGLYIGPIVKVRPILNDLSAFLKLISTPCSEVAIPAFIEKTLSDPIGINFRFSG